MIFLPFSLLDESHSSTRDLIYNSHALLVLNMNLGLSIQRYYYKCCRENGSVFIFILKDFAFSCYSLKLINFLVYAAVLLDGTQNTPFPDFQGPTPLLLAHVMYLPALKNIMHGTL
jgi:hypothetical protein